MKGRKMRTMGLLAAFLVGLLIFARHFIFSEAASEEGFAQIEKGMTKGQVLKLLGAPHHGRVADPNRRVFAYGGLKHFKWCTMEVLFDDGDRVSGKFHDH